MRKLLFPLLLLILLAACTDGSADISWEENLTPTIFEEQEVTPGELSHEIRLNDPHTEPMIPKWGFGFMQSYWNDGYDRGYGNQEGFVDHAEALRGIENPWGEHPHPADIMVLDMFWCGKEWGYPGNMTWDENNFPDPERMFQELHDLNFKVMMNYHVPNNRVDQEYLDQVQRDLDYGMDIPWLDYWSGGSYNETQIWNLMQQHFGENQRVMFMARHYARPNYYHHEGGTVDGVWHDGVGKQSPPNEDESEKSMPVHWTGDTQGTWNGFRETIEGMVYGTDGAMGGWSYLHSDTPGHTMGENKELAIRWIQFSDFTTGTRNHGVTSRDVWSWGEEVEDISYFSRMLRYRMLPYIYTYGHVIWEEAIPLTRPMRYAYPGQADDWKYQFMFGEELLAAPVYQRADKFDNEMMPVFLPRGEQWVNYWTHEIHQGDQVTHVPVGADHRQYMPLFVKRGAIIPMGPEIMWIDPAIHPDPLTLDTYPLQQGISEFTLYDDDGETLGYQNGEFATTLFSCDRQEDSIVFTLGADQGEYEGQPARRDYILKINLIDQPYSMATNNGDGLRFVSDYNDLLGEKGKSNAWAADVENRIVYVRISTSVDTENVIELR